MNMWIWVTILLIGGTNFVGFILYLLMRPKEPMIRCSRCYAKIVQTSMYCPHCGRKVTLPNDTRVSKPSSNSLIAAIVCMVAAILISMIATMLYFTTNVIDGSGNNYWEKSFQRLQGTESRTFTATSDQTTLNFSCEIKKGKIRFEVYNANDSLLMVIPQDDSEWRKENGISDDKPFDGWLKCAWLGQAGINGGVGGEFFTKGEEYIIKMIAQNAKGNFKFEMKDHY
jgi:hypothetical protein